jgi:DNA-binding transcriptional LysR family regulator
MNIESLRYFFLIAKAGNISSVAKEVHLTQSALSQQIQKLENDLDKKLLTRSNKGVTITDAGKIVSLYAENILRTYDTMVDELDEAEKDNVVLKIEACHSVADYALPCTLILANGMHPNHKYELTGNESGSVITNVSNNICDVGFICGKDIQVDYENVVSTKVGVNNVLLISKNDDTYPDTITLDRLLDYCLITFPEKNYITSLLEKNLKQTGHNQSSINCNLRVEGIEGAKILISRNFGVAFLPYISVKEELYKKQFKKITVSNFDMDIDIHMLYKKNCPGYIQDFVDWFKKNGASSFC